MRQVTYYTYFHEPELLAVDTVCTQYSIVLLKCALQQ